jgi:hypothetical protein
MPISEETERSDHWHELQDTRYLTTIPHPHAPKFAPPRIKRSILATSAQRITVAAAPDDFPINTLRLSKRSPQSI